MLIADAFHKVSAEVRAGNSPQIFEVETFRYREHVGVGEDYDAGYRKRSELLAWQELDPLITSRELRERYRPGIAAEIEDAVKFAEDSPWPDPEQLLKDVL